MGEMVVLDEVQGEQLDDDRPVKITNDKPAEAFLATLPKPTSLSSKPPEEDLTVIDEFIEENSKLEKVGENEVKYVLDGLQPAGSCKTQDMPVCLGMALSESNWSQNPPTTIAETATNWKDELKTYADSAKFRDTQNMESKPNIVDIQIKTKQKPGKKERQKQNKEAMK